MVMLTLILEQKPDIPVIHWRWKGDTRRYEFADKVASDWNINLVDYDSIYWDVVYRNGKMDVYNFKRINEGIHFIPAVEILPSSKRCAVQDFWIQEQKEFEYPYDVTFSGHKGSDVDALMGAVPLVYDAVQIGTTTTVFPLKDWTDKDIWDYTVKNNIPINHKRYGEGFREFEDKTYNENYHFACTECMNPERPETVYCHALNDRIKNISQNMGYESKIEYYRSLAPYIDFKE
jgi:hypothetical protein